MNKKEMIEKIVNRNPSIFGIDQLRKFGILVPVIQKDDDLHLLFEVRSKTLNKQPGEICFPGGAVDLTDPSPKYTAIRETSEELGIRMDEISNVYPLDYIVSSFGHRLIYPFVGFVKEGATFHPNDAEVDHIFTVPIQQLKEMVPECYKVYSKMVPEENFPFHLINGGKNYKWHTQTIDEYFYFYKEYCIWGLTANILRHFLSII